MAEPIRDWGALAAARLERIAECSEPGPGVTRLPFTSEHRDALEVMKQWMAEAGLAVHLDAAGTLVGRCEGPDGAPVLLLGSHQDSVRNGGRFDGVMGVVLPILALQALAGRGIRLPFAVECLAFADEEGVRFPTALVGPRALAGTLDPAVLDLADKEGTTLRAAMTGFGLDPDGLGSLARDPASVVGYLECHIEQGPVLEDAGKALAVVTGICGIERHTVALRGEAGHAGTIPMRLRRDALAGAAEVVIAVERLAGATEGLLGTVGALEVFPGVVNAEPGEARLTVELRAPVDAVREAAGAGVRALCEEVAARRGLALEQARTYAQNATVADPELTRLLADSVRATCGEPALRIASGATHDAAAMADLCPMAMLFLRCRDGASHNPAEFASAADMGAAIEAICSFLEHLAVARSG